MGISASTPNIPIWDRSGLGGPAATGPPHAGHSIVSGCGIFYNLTPNLRITTGLTFLNRQPDKNAQHEDSDNASHSEHPDSQEAEGTGIDAIYINPALRYRITQGMFKDLQFSLVAQLPIYQFVYGRQLADTFTISFGLAYTLSLFA